VGEVAQFVREVVREPEIRRDVAKQGHGNAVSIPVWERCLAKSFEWGRVRASRELPLSVPEAVRLDLRRG
jgi:hypothetical protein